MFRSLSLERRERSKRIRTLLKERKKIEKELANIEQQLTKELCPKGKVLCEPAYCTFRLTETCPFLKEWRTLTNQ